MRRVEVEKSYAECNNCINVAEMYNQLPNCDKCQRETGEWIDTVTNFWGTKAVVILDSGKVRHVSLSKIKVITKREA